MSYYIYYIYIYIQNKNSAKMVASEAAKSYGLNLYDEISKTFDFKVKVKTGKIFTVFTFGIGVAWNGKRFVAVGSGAYNIAYSDDGINWT